MAAFFLLLTSLLLTPESHGFGSKPANPTPPPTQPAPTPPKPAPTPPPPSVDCSQHISRAEWQKWSDNIVESGGRVASENSYPATADGFKRYLAAVGVSSARAAELTLPASATAAKKCGMTDMLPNRCVWIRGAALALWADRMAKLTGATTKVRNWNRPSCYNSAVGGANGSDHLQARAIDLYFSNATTRRKGQQSLCSTWAGRNMQVGMGGSMLHIGFESPAGRRFWYYASYTDSDRSTNCYAKGGKSFMMEAPHEDHEH